MDNKIKELTEKNKQLKDSVEDITKKYDNNRVFYELNKKVNQLPKKCFQYILPENGFYKFRETGCKRIWIISDQMRILRILSEIERQNILKNMNYNEKFEFEPYKKAMAKRMRRYNYGMDQL